MEKRSDTGAENQNTFTEFTGRYKMTYKEGHRKSRMHG